MSVSRAKKKELVDMVLSILGPGADADALIDIINNLPEQEIPE